MLEVSGSYILNALLIAAALRFWQTNSEAKKAFYLALEKLKEDAAGKDKRLALLEAEHSATQLALKEIKEDVKYIRERVPPRAG